MTDPFSVQTPQVASASTFTPPQEAATPKQIDARYKEQATYLLECANKTAQTLDSTSKARESAKMQVIDMGVLSMEELESKQDNWKTLKTVLTCAAVALVVIGAVAAFAATGGVAAGVALMVCGVLAFAGSKGCKEAMENLDAKKETLHNAAEIEGDYYGLRKAIHEGFKDEKVRDALRTQFQGNRAVLKQLDRIEEQLDDIAAAAKEYDQNQPVKLPQYPLSIFKP